MPTPTFMIRRLGPTDLPTVRAWLTMFGDAFGEPDTYTGAPPSDAYLEALLANECFVALAATKDGRVVGGLAAYELTKFEQARSEFYLYDLAVLDGHRREGMATGLIEALKPIAAARGGHVVFVQADAGDTPAIALYDKLGSREEVLNFDIELE